jgi:hypothetical protein
MSGYHFLLLGHDPSEFCDMYQREGARNAIAENHEIHSFEEGNPRVCGDLLRHDQSNGYQLALLRQGFNKATSRKNACPIWGHDRLRTPADPRPMLAAEIMTNFLGSRFSKSGSP